MRGHVIGQAAFLPASLFALQLYLDARGTEMVSSFRPPKEADWAFVCSLLFSWFDRNLLVHACFVVLAFSADRSLNEYFSNVSMSSFVIVFFVAPEPSLGKKECADNL